MKSIIGLLQITMLFTLISCESTPQKPGLSNPIKLLCIDSVNPGGAVSYSVFEETVDIWAMLFVEQYKVNNGGSERYHFSVPADTLSTYLECPPGNPNCYDGVKAYIGLDNSIDSIEQVVNHLSLIFVPYKNNEDIRFPVSTGPFIKVNAGNTREFIDSTTAQAYVNNWHDHYDNADSRIMVPIQSFVIPLSTLTEEIADAQDPLKDNDSSVHFTFGFRIISPYDPSYCYESSKGFKESPDYHGYAVIALILSTKKRLEETFEHTEDFLRPCPRFCGDAMFQFGA